MPSSARILIADDLAANRALLATMLSREGYAVDVTSDGQEALEILARQLPDLIVSDVMMPRLNGFELCRRLKTHRSTRLIPIVLVTSLGDREHRIQGIN